MYKKPWENNKKTNIVLIGFMGAGKSTVGRHLAKKLGYAFIDLDQAIEHATGLSVAEIFKRFGEVRFRSEERLAVQKLTSASNTVIATGGGTVLHPENWKILADIGHIVWLRAKPGALHKRVQRNKRPLLAEDSSVDRIKQLLIEREAIYARADYVLDTTQSPIRDLVKSLYRWVRKQSSHQLLVRSGGQAYSLWVGTDILPLLGQMLQDLRLTGKALVVSNQTVFQQNRYGETVQQSLAEAKLECNHFLVPEGEIAKSREVVESLYNYALEQEMEPRSPWIALGGGVVGDVTGFAAATFMRGVPLIQVPTTLLAQVDSSIGGKVAINHPRGKNLIGAYHQPRMVLADISTLSTLPAREIRNGLAEIIKCSIMEENDLFLLLEQNLEPILNLDPSLLTRIILQTCQFKASIVEADERDQGVRLFLNLGHTLGHALEAEGGFARISHGEAVAAGVAFAGRLALKNDLWSEAEQSRLETLLQRSNLRLDLSGYQVEPLLQRLKVDKKSADGAVRWILPAHIGIPPIVTPVAEQTVIPVLNDFLQEWSAK